MARISVFCGSSHGKDARIIEDIKTLGLILGQTFHHINYGGGLYGHLKDLMDSVGKGSAKMSAILSPTYYDAKETYPSFVTVVKALDDEDRVNKLLDADAFVITPGGDGTLAEAFFSHNRNLSAVYDNKALKPTVFLDTNDFYKNLREHFKHMADLGYSNDKRQEQLHFEKTPQDVIDTIIRELKK